MRTIQDYIKDYRASTMDEIAEMLQEAEAEIIDELNQKGHPKEEVIQMIVKTATGMSECYNKGFDDCLALIQECDVNFLRRKVPAHLK